MDALISDPKGSIRIEYSGGPEDAGTGCEFGELRRVLGPQSANDAMYAAVAPVCICTERAPGVKGNVAHYSQDKSGAHVWIGDVK